MSEDGGEREVCVRGGVREGRREGGEGEGDGRDMGERSFEADRRRRESEQLRENRRIKGLRLYAGPERTNYFGICFSGTAPCDFLELRKLCTLKMMFAYSLSE